MHTSITILGILLRFVGVLPGIAGVGGFVLAIIGDPNAPPLWWSAALMLIGMIVMGVGMLLAGYGINRMGHIGKRILFAGIAAPMGFYLFYFGLGITGLFYLVPQLDPLNIFEYVQPHWIAYLLVLCGGGMTLWGLSFIRAPRAYVDSIGVG